MNHLQKDLLIKHKAKHYISSVITNESSSHKTSFRRRKVKFCLKVYIMNNKVRHVPAAIATRNRAISNTKSIRTRRSLPKRGQIKSRIAARAYNALVSALSSKAHSEHKRTHSTDTFEDH